MYFTANSGKSENLHFDVLLLSKVILCVITLKNDVHFEEELTCALKNDKFRSNT